MENKKMFVFFSVVYECCCQSGCLTNRATSELAAPRYTTTRRYRTATPSTLWVRRQTWSGCHALHDWGDRKKRPPSPCGARRADC